MKNDEQEMVVESDRTVAPGTVLRIGEGAFGVVISAKAWETKPNIYDVVIKNVSQQYPAGTFDEVTEQDKDAFWDVAKEML